MATSNAVDADHATARQAGSSAVGILRAMTNHLMRSKRPVSAFNPVKTQAPSPKVVAPPVFFKLERRFRGQVLIWRGRAPLGGCVSTRCGIELQAHRYWRLDPVCGRALLQIASLPGNKDASVISVQPISPRRHEFLRRRRRGRRGSGAGELVSIPASPRSSISTFRPA